MTARVTPDQRKTLLTKALEGTACSPCALAGPVDLTRADTRCFSFAVQPKMPLTVLTPSVPLSLSLSPVGWPAQGSDACAGP